ncbi:MAG: hypothetical protein U5N56_05995 [Candidatus Marinimicrobia bacterium]|nr:hypothetical protein [Candidatus Neomarinimicrobiota bacterium]
MKIRKLHVTVLFILILFAGSLFAWDGFTYVFAAEHDAGIRIEWQVKNERDVSYYEVWRSRSEDDVLSGTRILRQGALGDGASYTHLDNNIFGKTSTSGDFTFYYVVRAVLNNGTYKDSDNVRASLSTLGVRQQTWGSIKAMFR